MIKSNHPKQRWAFVALAVLLSATLLALVFARRAPDGTLEVGSDSTAPAPVLDQDGAQPAPAATTAAANQRVGLRPNPLRSSDVPTPATNAEPVGIRIADEFESLASAADAGNRHAACRLGLSLSLCRNLPQMESALRSLEREAAQRPAGSKDEQEDVERLVELEGRSKRVALLCEGLPPERAQNAWKYVSKAAELGDADAIVALLLFPPLDPEKMLDNLAEWQTYRSRFWEFTQRGVNKGDPRILYIAYGLISGQDRLPGMTSSPVPRDPRLAMTYATLLQRLVDARGAARLERDLQALRDEVPEQDQMTARADAEKLYFERFRDAKPIDPFKAMVRSPSPEDCQ